MSESEIESGQAVGSSGTPTPGTRVNAGQIPSWLETPCLSQVALPVETRCQKLPYQELDWRDFERLCLRLVRLEAEVESCRLYGVPGQSQDGIDIYARMRSSDKHAVYQCKRVERPRPGIIRDAVKEFLAGEWSQKSRRLVLCTAQSLRKSSLANAIEEQRRVLAASDIGLEPWDSEELDIKLKGQSEIVDDFFGRAWAAKFCGEIRAEQLRHHLSGPVHKFANVFWQESGNVRERFDVGLWSEFLQ